MYISSSSSSSSFPDPGPLLAMGTNRRSPLPSAICRDIYSKILTYTRYVCKCRRPVCIQHSIKMFVRLSLKANNYFFRVYPCYKRYRLYTTTCCRLRAVGLALPHGANGSSSVEIILNGCSTKVCQWLVLPSSFIEASDWHHNQMELPWHGGRWQ